MGDERAVTVAVDVGGTSLKGAVFEATGAVLSRRTTSTAAHEDVLSGLTDLVDRLIADARFQGRQPDRIGIASPGIVDSANGSITYAANLDWADLQLSDAVGERFGISTTVEHDARAGAIAERAAHPQDARFDNFVFVPIGTGVAAAVVTGGTGAGNADAWRPTPRPAASCGATRGTAVSGPAAPPRSSPASRVTTWHTWSGRTPSTRSPSGSPMSRPSWTPPSSCSAVDCRQPADCCWIP
jgi:hypothetical protein